MGMAIDIPQVILEAEMADKRSLIDLENQSQEVLCQTIGPTKLIIKGRERERVQTFAQRFLERFPLPGTVLMDLKRSIPPHIGLGSGTQLALAVGASLAKLAQIRISLKNLALIMGRGVHSGIGIGTFRYGGFIVDGGHSVKENEPGIPPILFRCSVPNSWHFLIAVPSQNPGLAGNLEQQAFQSLPPAPPHLSEKICRLLLIQMLPALKEGDLRNFAQALTLIQQLVGECFAPVQGGRFANPVSEKLIEYWLSQGVSGAGQSSWGPTVYALLGKKQEALELKEKSEEWLKQNGGGQIFLARANNQGASFIPK
jgi:beta-RFAP synthase